MIKITLNLAGVMVIGKKLTQNNARVTLSDCIVEFKIYKTKVYQKHVITREPKIIKPLNLTT